MHANVVFIIIYFLTVFQFHFVIIVILVNNIFSVNNNNTVAFLDCFEVVNKTKTVNFL